MNDTSVLEKMENLKNKIIRKKVSIAIVGIGYVGLPLCLRFVKKKFKVFGIEKDLKKIDFIKKKKSYIANISDKEIKNAVSAGFKVTQDFSIIQNVDVIIICVPTPLNKNKTPDMKYVSNSVKKIKKYLKKKQMIIVESTVYPGATEEFFLPALAQKKLKPGKDIFLAYSPEREDPGNKSFTIARGNIPKIISGFSPICLDLAKTLYSCITKTVMVSSIKTAEFTKLLENVYRSINIGFVNEMKLIANKMNINIHESIEAAKTKPFGFQAFYPGPGLGGHCIPIDPFILTWKAKKFGLKTRFIELSAKINESMPRYAINVLLSALKKTKKKLNKSKILILGISYKKNSDDIRESPSLKIISLLSKFKCKIFFSDPFFQNKLKLNNLKQKIPAKAISLNAANLKKFDAVILVTDHDNFNYNLIKNNSKIIVDCRNKFKKEINKIYLA